MNSSTSRRDIFLNEMGVGPVWRQRGAAPSVAQPEPMPAIEAAPLTAMRPVAPPSAWSDEPERKQVAPLPVSPRQASTAPSAAEIAEMDFTQLKAAVANCTKCGLCRGRTKTVFGVGDEQAKWLFIGEGPGRNEDLQGEPFVGPAGKLLDNMLVAMDMKRGSNAYIANIVKCRPTDENGRDRPPTAEESAACLPYLQRQIVLIQPAVLIALGKTAAVSLLQLDPATPVSKLRGSVHRYAERPLVVTYHPAYLLRTPVDKRKAWADLCLAMKTYAGLSQ